MRFEALLNNLITPERFDSIVQSPYLHRVTLTTKDGKVTQMTTFEKLVTDRAMLEIQNLLDDQGNPMDPINRIYGLINEGKDQPEDLGTQRTGVCRTRQELQDRPQPRQFRQRREGQDQ